MCDIFAHTYTLYYKCKFDAAGARDRLDTYLTTYGFLGFFLLGNDERGSSERSGNAVSLTCALYVPNIHVPLSLFHFHSIFKERLDSFNWVSVGYLTISGEWRTSG